MDAGELKMQSNVRSLVPHEHTDGRLEQHVQEEGEQHVHPARPGPGPGPSRARAPCRVYASFPVFSTLYAIVSYHKSIAGGHANQGSKKPSRKHCSLKSTMHWQLAWQLSVRMPYRKATALFASREPGPPRLHCEKPSGLLVPQGKPPGLRMDYGTLRQYLGSTTFKAR